MPDERNPAIGAYTFNLLQDVGDNAGPEQQSEIESLLHRLEAHDASERHILKDYEDYATKSSDEGVRYLMGLIVEDEKRHNQFLEAMASEVRRSLVWDHGKRALPSIHATGAEREELLAKAKRFLDIERDGKRQLDQLEGIVRGFDKGDGILSLITEVMAFDTQKHVVMLDYIRRHLQTD